MTNLLEQLAEVPTTQTVRRSPGADAVARYLRSQIDVILAGDAELRAGRDPIHDTRVAIRRLRSTLRVFGVVIDTDVSAFRDDLKWFAGVLGEVRDRQVQARRLSRALDALPEELVLGPVRSRIRDGLRAGELPARAEVSTAMETPRYLALTTQLQHWRDNPPVVADTTSEQIEKLGRKAAKKADRRLVEAVDTGEDDSLHRARKAAKRARYAAELGRPLGHSKKAKRNIKHYKKIQSALGDHQDAVVAPPLLRQLGAIAGTTAGENGFTFGLLYERESATAVRCRSDAASLL